MYTPFGLEMWEIVVASWLCSWAVLGVTTACAVAVSWWVYREERVPAPVAAPAKPVAAPAGAPGYAAA